MASIRHRLAKLVQVILTVYLLKLCADILGVVFKRAQPKQVQQISDAAEILSLLDQIDAENTGDDVDDTQRFRPPGPDRHPSIGAQPPDPTEGYSNPFDPNTTNSPMSPLFNQNNHGSPEFNRDDLEELSGEGMFGQLAEIYLKALDEMENDLDLDRDRER